MSGALSAGGFRLRVDLCCLQLPMLEIRLVFALQDEKGKRTGYFCSLLIAHAVGPVESVVELDEELSVSLEPFVLW